MLALREFFWDAWPLAGRDLQNSIALAVAPVVAMDGTLGAQGGITISVTPASTGGGGGGGGEVYVSGTISMGD